MTLNQEQMAWPWIRSELGVPRGSRKGKWPGQCGLRESDGNEVREVGRAECMTGQGKGSASGFFFLELSGLELQSLKRERSTAQSREPEIGNELWKWEEWLYVEIRDGWLKLALLCRDKLVRKRSCGLLKGSWTRQVQPAEWFRAWLWSQPAWVHSGLHHTLSGWLQKVPNDFASLFSHLSNGVTIIIFSSYGCTEDSTRWYRKPSRNGSCHCCVVVIHFGVIEQPLTSPFMFEMAVAMAEASASWLWRHVRITWGTYKRFQIPGLTLSHEIRTSGSDSGFRIFSGISLGNSNLHPGLGPADRSVNILGRSVNMAAEVGAQEKHFFSGWFNFDRKARRSELGWWLILVLISS